MKLEYPINDSLPNIEHTRDRLLAKVFDFRAHAVGDHFATDEDFELLYAYGKNLVIDLYRSLAHSAEPSSRYWPDRERDRKS